MAKKKYHNLYKRGKSWYFRKNNFRKSLETTVATEAIRLRDILLENYIMTGNYSFTEDEMQQFGDIVVKWASIHSKKVKYSTWRDYRSIVNTHIIPFFGEMPIEKIAFLDVEQFISTLNCGAKRINNILIPLRSVFLMSHKQGLVKENIMLKVDNRSIQKSQIYPFTHDEVIKILKCIDPAYQPYTAVRFYTGIRAGEIDGLKWSDYKDTWFSTPKISINKTLVYGIEGETKTNKSKRNVDCLAPVIKAIDEQRKINDKNEHIFCKHDGALMNPDHFREVIWKKALKSAEIEYRPPSQTRHTFATMMITAGEDIGWVQKMMGHSSLQMIFNHYYSWIPQKTRSDGTAFINSIQKNEDAEKVMNIFGKMAQ